MTRSYAARKGWATRRINAANAWRASLVALAKKWGGKVTVGRGKRRLAYS